VTQAVSVFVSRAVSPLTDLTASLASIFKRGSESSKPRYGSRMDFESTYRKYKVQRKMPIGKHDRILAIDGDYIHVRTLSSAECRGC
jgi:hypothetical protein